VTSAPATRTVRAVAQPRITLAKSASPATYDAPSVLIAYSYQVTNTGNVTLDGVTLTDDRLGAIGCPLATLAPGEPMTCYGAHVTTAADMDAGSITNLATAAGHPPAGPAVTASDGTTVTAASRPAVSIAKSAFPASYGAAGETITYAYLVTNTGNVALHAITVTDNKVSGPVACLAATLAAGESTTCQAVHVITPADLAAGHVTNTGTATGRPPAGPAVTDSSTQTVTAAARPGIGLGKSASPATFSDAGEVIAYAYTVTNTGNAPLRAVTVRDDRVGAGVTCPAITLAPGASMTCRASYVTTAADVAAGYVTNVAAAAGTTPSGATVTGRAQATVPLRLLPFVPVIH
jgi:uncharacterized repeat protein (TIGR01451 family)